jgi:hypothetical protein
MVTPAAERKAVAHLREAFGMSERQACNPHASASRSGSADAIVRVAQILTTVAAGLYRYRSLRRAVAHRSKGPIVSTVGSHLLE